MSQANPFLDTYSAPLTPKRGLLLTLLAPFALFRLCIVVSMFVLFSLYFLVLHDPSSAPCKKRFHYYPWVIRSSSWGARTVMRCLGFKIKILGGEHLKRCYTTPGCPIIVMNHVSYMDVVVAIGIFGPYFPVAREDMKDWFLVGRILRLWGFLGVPRELPGGQKGAGLSAALVERTRKADGMWLENPPVLIFPEGTCTTGRQLLRFKSGAFVPGRPVLPVTLNYKTRSGINSGWVLPPPVTAPFWRGLPRDITHLIRIVAATGKEIEVTISPPYVPSPEEEKNPALFAANVRRTMAAMLGAPAECDFSGDDAKEFYKRVDDAASRTAR